MQSFISPVLQKLSFLKSEGVRQVLAYFMGTLLLFMLLLMADRLLLGMDSRSHLLGFMTVTLLTGTLNVWLLGRSMFGNVPEWLKAMLTLAANMIGGVIFMALLPSTYNPVYGQLILPALLLFSLPWFFVAAVQVLMSIPALIYKPLQVLDLRDIVAEINWAENEERGIIWVFNGLSEMDSAGLYEIRTHTPHGVENLRLKDLFKSLLSLHNHNLSHVRPIHFKEKRPLRKMSNEVVNGQFKTELSGEIEVPFGWRFFYQKKFLLWHWQKPLDPEKSLRQNGVRFQPLTDAERAEMTNLRKGLSPNFRTTNLFIKRS